MKNLFNSAEWAPAAIGNFQREALVHNSRDVMAARGEIEMIDIIDMSISDKSCHHIGNIEVCRIPNKALQDCRFHAYFASWWLRLIVFDCVAFKN